MAVHNSNSEYELPPAPSFIPADPFMLATKIEHAKELVDWNPSINTKEKEEGMFGKADLYHLDMYLVDINSDYMGDIENIVARIEDCTDLKVHVSKAEQKRMPWHDDIDLNYMSATSETCAAYFDEEDD